MKSVAIKASGVRRLRSGGLWVYANEVSDALPAYEKGELVSVLAPSGEVIGVAYVEPASLIALRMLRRSVGPVDAAFLEGRIRAADRRRARLVGSAPYRAVFSESDRLPGLIVDRYGDLCAVQLLTWGMERLKSEVITVLRTVYEPRAIVFCNASESRSFLGLATDDDYLVFDGETDLSCFEVQIAGLSLLVDFKKAQKTGLYLDQVHSYHCVAGIDFSGLSGLDLFCYSGIFGMLALKRGAARVEFVDSSAEAIALLGENLERNTMPHARYSIVRAKVMDHLAGLPAESRDFLFLDPPKFIKSKKSYYGGLQGYFNLNRAAVRVIGDGGLLFTFSCSHHAGEAVFRKKVLDAIAKCGCSARELLRFRQNADHPVLIPMEESFYLKGFLFSIDRHKEKDE